MNTAAASPVNNTLVSTFTKRFPGGVTTAYVLSSDDGSYTVKVSTRFDSGNYLNSHHASGLAPADAMAMAATLTR